MGESTKGKSEVMSGKDKGPVGGPMEIAMRVNGLLTIGMEGV